jgi:hypothetical protein
MDEWTATVRLPAVALPGTPNHPSRDRPLDTARSYMG